MGWFTVTVRWLRKVVLLMIKINGSRMSIFWVRGEGAVDWYPAGQSYMSLIGMGQRL